MKTTVSPKMQITVPMKLARLFDVRVGDVVRFTRHEATPSIHRLLVELVREGRRHQTFRVTTRRTPSFRGLELVAHNERDHVS